MSKVLDGTDDLMPISASTLKLVYGGLDYVRSVFGHADITRNQLADYYRSAEHWTRYPMPAGTSRNDIVAWCRSQGIGSLHYWAPFSHHGMVFFKEPEHALLCALRFGN